VHVPDRPLTWIERTVLRQLVDQAAGIMVRAWQEQIPVDLTLAGFEAVPEMLPGSVQESTLVARLRIGGTGWVSTLTQALPAPAVNRALTRRRADRPKLDPLIEAENRRRITSRLQGAKVPLSVRLPRFTVRLRDVSSLEVGSVIVSDLPADTGVEVFVSDQIRFRGRVGRQDQHLAVEVLESTAPCPHERDSE
jgi:flagellar motor switch protein FliM